MKRPSRRLLTLLGVAVLTAAIGYLPYGEQGDIAAPAKAKPQLPASPQAQPAAVEQKPAVGHVELERLNQQKDNGPGSKVTNAFTPRTWYVPPPPPPPPPPPAPPPPPPPTAPPLPFTYLGRYEDPPKLFAILANGSKVYTVSQGEVIDGIYRVDRIADGVVDLVYLPLNISQSVKAAESKLQPPGPGEYNRRR